MTADDRATANANTDERLTTADLAKAAERPREKYEAAEQPRHGTDDTRGVRQAAMTADQERIAPPLPDRTRPDAAKEAALFDGPETERLRTRWTDIQSGFVDEPRRAVKDADTLVAEVMKRLAEVFANERTGLERQWDRGDNATTEDLRVALQRYRSFFDRLLSV